MKIYIWIVTILQIVAGLFFLFNSVSDIQMGFGVVLLLMGLASVPNAIQKQ